MWCNSVVVCTSNVCVCVCVCGGSVWDAGGVPYVKILHPSGAGRQDLRALGQKPRVGPVDGSQAPLQPVVAGFFAQYWSLVMPALHARHVASIDMQQYGAGDGWWWGADPGEGLLCGAEPGVGWWGGADPGELPCVPLEWG